tara:strand:- start:2358 stop:2975 length:618 start_codon:yes stop_codon:yes gene_type:complete
MRLVKTADQSNTFFNEEYQETYHSTSGALEESFEKFIKPSKLKENSKVLDICFGIGYNSYAAIKTCENLTIVALENDEKILKNTNNIKLDEKYEIIKKLAKDKVYKDENYNLKLIVGDARKTIKQIKEKFDYIFLDPFSPKKCPELWTEEFFKDIFSLCNPGTTLTTYSCARTVRDNLKKVGFEVKDGPCVGRRSPSTIATKPSS